jgi:hypothetical protein
MATEAALRGMYEREIHPLLETHAAALERLAKHGLYPIGVFLIAVLGLMGSVLARQSWPALVCVAVLLPTVAVLKVRVPVYQASGAAFRALFKQRVVSRVVEQVLPGAAYDPDLAIARSVLAASAIVRSDSSYLGDDLVRGTIGRTPFALGDVRSGRSGGRAGAARPFQGLFFHADFNRSTAGRTLVIPQGESPIAVPGNRALVPTTLESPEFEALFSVFATDAVEARYVVTPKMMVRLVELQRLLGHRLYAAFDRGRVYVALDKGAGSFDALAFGGEQAWQEIRGFAALMGAARAIVEELELNTRIWTKGFAPEDESRAAAAFEPSAWAQVAARGANAFRRSGPLPFRTDDPPAAPAGTRLERRPSGALVARYPGGAATVAVLGVLLSCAAALVGAWWAPANGALRDAGLRDLAWFLEAQVLPVSLLAAAVVATALYGARQRVLRMEAGSTGIRTAAPGRPEHLLPRARITRVFAAEDLVLAQTEGSWIPTLLSPRLGSHGAALWLTKAIEEALGSQ